MILPRNPATPPLPAEYGAEVLCAGWNPVVAAAPEPAARAAPGMIPAADAEFFLDLFYRLQQA